MKRIFFILLVLVFSSNLESQAQGLQPGECGIMFTYDASGNLEQREFICNNTGVIMERIANVIQPKQDSLKTLNAKILEGEIGSKNDEIIRVNAVMPNPTTGKFIVRLAKPLSKATVLLLDANGKNLERRIETGDILTFDLSAHPSGMYFVRIESEKKVFTFKVIKG